MSESIWQHESCSPGRDYMLGKDPYIRYDDEKAIVSGIVEGLREFIHAEPAVRLTLDTSLSNPERAILAVPFESDQEVILSNLAHIIYQSLIGYYISAVPKTSHYGISNLLLEGNYNSLLKREIEKLISQFQSRSDMAGRLLRNVGLVGKYPVQKPGKTFLSETIKNGLDIHVGYRVYATGKNVNCSQIFIPLQAGHELIDLIYYNIERILHHGFVTYDETGDYYLNITETLVFRDLAELLKRSKDKELTRNKILNNLQFNTIIKTDPDSTAIPRIGDRLYDVLNHIQDTKLREATDRSRDLYVASLTGNENLVHEQLRFSEVSSALPDAQPSGGTDMRDPPQNGLPVRKFKRRGAPEGGKTRRKFQKITLTNDEMSINKVQVPSPPDENLRVPAPKRKRRITRIRKESGVLSGKE